jgi:hypothetical protein
VLPRQASVEDLVAALQLPSDESKSVIDALTSESVTLKQLATLITDDELQEIGISNPEIRSALLKKARVCFRNSFARANFFFSKFVANSLFDCLRKSSKRFELYFPIP